MTRRDPTARGTPSTTPTRDRATPSNPRSDAAVQAVDADKAKLDPTSVFDQPRDVLSSNLPLEDKSAILRRWRYDAAEMSVAAEEGMDGGESALLDQVIRAQQALGDATGGESGQGAKQGLS